MFASFDNGSSSCHYSTDHYTMFRNDSIQDLSSIFMTSPFTDYRQDGLLQQQQEEEELLLAQLAQQQLLTDTVATVSARNHNNTISNADNKKDSLNGNKGATGTTASNKRSIKRSGKKDRHSKIATAQGIRDRRMRLSLEVAHRFFTLQDMLGFDKASKTVEWLLTKSKSAIRELAKGLSQRKHTCIGVTSTTEYDQVISEIEEGQLAFSPKGKYSLEERKKSTTSNKPTFNHVLAKESRAKARERARERTIEKMRSRGLDKIKQKNPQEMNFQNLKSLSPFEKGGSRTNIDMKSSMSAVMAGGEEPIFHSDQVHQGPNIEDIVDESFVITRNSSSPTSNFKNHHNVAMSNFTDTWGTNVEKTAGNIREIILDSIFFTPTDRDVRFQSPFDADVQLYGKPWDLYDNQINSKID